MSDSLEYTFKSLRHAQEKIAVQNRAVKDKALSAAAVEIDKSRSVILEANAHDVKQARLNGMKESLVDRLLLDNKRIDSMIEGIEIIIRQEDPIGRVQTGWVLPNGLQIEKVTVPIGVAAIIYESRPNVTVDSAALAYKAGCSILLRGSSSALESNKALVKAIKTGLNNGGGIADAVAMAQSGNRDEIDEILKARGFIDAVLPRGGHDLIRRVVENACVPVIETGEGNCHIYVEPSADMEKAVDIILNAKLQKPGVCNAVETLLVHEKALNTLIPELLKKLSDKCKNGRIELRCDSASKDAVSKTFVDNESGKLPANLLIKDASGEDWETEFLDNILAIKTVSSCDEAITHINKYGTKHSEAILTNDLSSADVFRSRVDAACVYVNASTRFTDGGQFGFGAELGISTQKFHARGPMGLEALTTIKYLITGSGQIRN